MGGGVGVGWGRCIENWWLHKPKTKNNTIAGETISALEGKTHLLSISRNNYTFIKLYHVKINKQNAK